MLCQLVIKPPGECALLVNLDLELFDAGRQSLNKLNQLRFVHFSSWARLNSLGIPKLVTFHRFCLVEPRLGVNRIHIFFYVLIHE